MANCKSYVKKVLVDEAELDRLQQRQLREYSPELASLARLKSNMDSILRSSNLSPQEKLTRLAAVQGRFEKIRKDAGVLSSTAAAAIALPPQVAPPQPPQSTDAGDEDVEDGQGCIHGVKGFLYELVCATVRILTNWTGSRQAPPTRAPSTSRRARNSPTLSGVTLPP